MRPDRVQTQHNHVIWTVHSLHVWVAETVSQQLQLLTVLSEDPHQSSHLTRHTAFQFNESFLDNVTNETTTKVYVLGSSTFRPYSELATRDWYVTGSINWFADTSSLCSLTLRSAARCRDNLPSFVSYLLNIHWIYCFWCNHRHFWFSPCS